MGLINRSDKGGGMVNFADRVAAGDTAAEAAEVDADFNAIFNEFNGVISADNLAANAVTTAKILDANVTTAKIADNSITNAKMADNAVNTVEIVDNAVTNAKMADNAINTVELVNLAVTAGKLAVQAGTPAYVNAAITPGLVIQAVVQTLVTLGAMTVRGGRVLLTGVAYGTLSSISVAAKTLTVTIERDDGAGFAAITNGVFTIDTPAISSQQLACSFPISFIDTPSAGSRTYRLRAITSSANLIWTISAATAGHFAAIEFA